MRRCPKSQEGEIQEPFSSRLTWIFPTGKKISPFPHGNKKKKSDFLPHLQCPHPTAQPLFPAHTQPCTQSGTSPAPFSPPAFPFPWIFFQVLEKKMGQTLVSRGWSSLPTLGVVFCQVEENNRIRVRPQQPGRGFCRVPGTIPSPIPQRREGPADQRRQPRAVVPINDICSHFAAGPRLSCTNQRMSGSCCGGPASPRPPALGQTEPSRRSPGQRCGGV